jgi:predicted nucleotidyltransferase
MSGPAWGTHDQQSDVDLAVEGLPSAVYFHALADLMDLLAGPVDLVRIEEAMPCLSDAGRPTLAEAAVALHHEGPSSGRATPAVVRS